MKSYMNKTIGHNKMLWGYTQFCDLLDMFGNLKIDQWETFFAQIASSGLAPSTCADVAGDAVFSLTPEAESAADNNGKRATSNESAQHERMLICSTNLAMTPNQHRAFRESSKPCRRQQPKKAVDGGGAEEERTWSVWAQRTQ